MDYEEILRGLIELLPRPTARAWDVREISPATDPKPVRPGWADT